MEIKQTLNSNSISFKMKETLKDLLSIIDGNSYLDEDSTVIMPQELKDSLQSLSEQEKQYQETGMLNSFLKKSISQSRVDKSKTSRTKTKLNTSSKQIISKITDKENKGTDIEIDR